MKTNKIMTVLVSTMIALCPFGHSAMFTGNVVNDWYGLLYEFACNMGHVFYRNSLW